MISSHIYIGAYKGMLPYMIQRRDESAPFAKLDVSGWCMRTNYVHRIVKAMRCSEKGVLNRLVSNGHTRFAIGNGFVMDTTNRNILVLAVGLEDGSPKIIFVSDMLDKVRPDFKYRSIRAHWRKAMSFNKDNGVRMAKVSQSFLNHFIVQFNWQPENDTFDIVMDKFKRVILNFLRSSL